MILYNYLYSMDDTPIPYRERQQPRGSWRQAKPPIVGGVHAALGAQDALVGELRPGEMHQVLAPKIFSG